MQEEGQGHVAGRLYVPGAFWRTDGFEQLSSSHAAQTGQRTGFAEADIPGHPPHHRHAWQDQKGSRQGHPGDDAALQGLGDNGRLHAVARTGSAHRHQLDLCGVGWYGHYRTHS